MELICEIGVNHNGSMSLAHEMIDTIATHGGKIAKFQAISQETNYNFATVGGDVYNAVKAAHLAKDQFVELKSHCDEKSIEFMCSAADIPALEMLCDIGVQRLKFSSGNFNNFHLLSHLQGLSQDVILSCGMANKNEILKTLDFLRDKLALTNNISLLYCVSNYPALPSDFDFAMLDFISGLESIDKIGFSDHSVSNVASIIAIQHGAEIIEKHITLDKQMSGPDHSFSLTGAEVERLLLELNEASKIVSSYGSGSGDKVAHKSLRRVLYANQNIRKGEIIRSSMIAAKRPFNIHGTPPEDYSLIIGRKSNCDIKINTMIQVEDLE